MGKIVAYPKKRLFTFFRVLLILSIVVLVYCLVQFVLTGFSLVYLLGVFTSLACLVFFFIKSVLNAVYFVVDNKVVYIYRSRQLVTSLALFEVKVSLKTDKRGKDEALVLQVNDDEFICSNLEYEGYDLLKRALFK